MREVRFDKVAHYNLEFPLLRFALHPLLQLSRHARVHLDGQQALAFLENEDGEIAGAGPYFEQLFVRLDVCFFDNGLADAGIDEDVCQNKKKKKKPKQLQLSFDSAICETGSDRRWPYACVLKSGFLVFASAAGWRTRESFAETARGMMDGSKEKAGQGQLNKCDLYLQQAHPEHFMLRGSIMTAQTQGATAVAGQWTFQVYKANPRSTHT